MITRTRFVRRPAACPWPTTLAGVALAAWLGSASAAVFDFRVDRGLQLLRVNMRRAAAGEISVRARFHDTAAPDPLARLHVTAVLGHEDEGEVSTHGRLLKDSRL